jgi:hypothetical protein
MVEPISATGMAILAITELILKYGPAAAIAIITAWEVEEPTVSDWEALKVKSADSYFDTVPPPDGPAE